ncbi:MAG TPA: F0F1 ATP synthase subunit delta [Chloroflexota bacterium]|nr:F0F1 ATP synthase subunit delta [Chloroflexota bacterium]
MPRTSVRATRYAQAAFAVGVGEDQLDTWLEALNSAAALLGDPTSEQYLTSPVVPAERKRAALAELLPGLPAPISNFLGILARRDRVELVPGIATVFRRLVDEQRGIEVAQVTTAIPLDERQRELLATRLARRTGRQVTLETYVDPSILGGVVAQLGDDVIDDSVRGRLERLRRALTA